MKARALMMLLLMMFLPSVMVFREMSFQPLPQPSFMKERRMPNAAEVRADAYARRLERCDHHHVCLPWEVSAEESGNGVGRTGTDQVVKPFSRLTMLG